MNKEIRSNSANDIYLNWSTRSSCRLARHLRRAYCVVCGCGLRVTCQAVSEATSNDDDNVAGKRPGRHDSKGVQWSGFMDTRSIQWLAADGKRSIGGSHLTQV
jgi:hypothetical protein